MAGLGALANNPLLNFILSMVGNAEQQQTQNEYEGATDQQIADAMRVASQVGPESLSTYDDSSNRGLSELFNLRNRAGQGYYDRYAAAEQDIEGYGDQMKEDIDADSRRTAGENELFLRERGLFNAATAPNFALRVEKDRSAEQRRLGEDLTRQRVNLLSGLSGEALNADQMNTGNIANWFGTSAANRSNLTAQGYNTMLDAIMGINRVPPPNNMLNYQLGSNSVQPVQPQGNWFSSLMGGAAPGIGTGVGAGLTSWLLPK